MTMPDEELAILRERARALAEPRTPLGAFAVADRQALFERAGARYALDMRYVYGVARVLSPTPLPGSERHWLGVTSLHGELLAIVDLHALFTGAHEQTVQPGTADALAPQESDTLLILVVGLEQREFGIAVDAVLDAQPIAGPLAREKSEDGRGEELLQGIAADGTRVLLPDALLRDRRLFIETSEPRET